MKASRFLAGALSACLLLGGLPPAQAAPTQEDDVKGSVTATVRLDHIQRKNALRDRAVTATLSQGGKTLGEYPLWEDRAESSWAVQLRNQDGGELGGGAIPGYVDLAIHGLSRGIYTLTFSGRGYVSGAAQVTLDTCSQHVIVGTGDGSFPLGDVTGDGSIDREDQAAVAQALGSSESGDLRRYDLDGDGNIDIVDLAYVSRLISSAQAGKAQVLGGALLAPPVGTVSTNAVVAGGLDSLFQDGGQTSKLSPKGGKVTEQSPVTLDIPLTAATRLSQLELVSPAQAGALQKGEVRVELQDGTVKTIPFDQTPPEGVHAIGPEEGRQVVTISLGGRVAVKKVTVTVTQTEGGSYAVLETIRFLQDIVPENPVAPNSVVKGLTATAGNESVSLRWDELPNISGYRVEYWPTSNSALHQSVQVSVPRAEITGLKNLTEYTFVVTPTDTGWAGKASAPVTATPQPSAAPSAPDMVTVSAGEGSLTVSWKAAENATYYKLFYTDQKGAATSAYRQYGGRLERTSTTISGLQNDVTYYIYVIAGNDKGESGPSRISTGSPKAVSYERPAGIPSQGVLDHTALSKIELAAPNNYDKSQYTSDAPFQPGFMADGDYRTSWTSGGWNTNEHVICTFKKPQSLSAILWVPRLDGNYASRLRAYSVRVWRQGDDLNGPGTLLVPDPAAGGRDEGGTGSDVHTWPSISNRGSLASDKFAILPIPPTEKIVKLSVAAEQSGYQNNSVTLSEILFMEYDKSRCLPDNITALFSDELHTSLRKGVTQKEIEALRARLNSSEKNYYLNLAAMADELKLAEELLKSGKTSGLVIDGIQSRSASSQYSQGGSDLQPLGAAAKAGDQITIYASGIPAGGTVTLYASQYNAEANAWRAAAGTLVNGRNLITVPKIGSQNTDRGGSLYLSYSGTGADKIRLHVRRTTMIPVLDVSNWYTMSDSQRREAIGGYISQLTAYSGKINLRAAQTAWNNVTEIATPTLLLSLPATAVASGLSGSTDKTATLTDAILAWEDLMHICKTTQGIDRTYERNDMQPRQNIRCMQMFAGAFMYAAGNHIGIGYGSCSGMVNGKPIGKLAAGANANGLYGWGIAHEIGHNMDKLGRAEITNNIYALMVQTYDGKDNTLPSRLEKSNKYTDIFNKTAVGYPGASGNVFVQLGLYWQLHLAYDGGAKDSRGPLWFYNQFFKAWKAGTYFSSGNSYDEKVALTAAGVVQRDLSPFFTRWGMELGQAAMSKLQSYPKEDRAIWYLSDQSRRARLAGQGGASGTLAASAALAAGSDTEVVIRITPQLTGTVQGYEIRRNGKAIAFTSDTSYTDVIGSANHRTFTYSVAAYDLLGREVAQAQAGEVRVAYDKAVDPSAYQLNLSGGTATFTFKKPTAISGLKVTGNGWKAGGNYTVSIAGEDGAAVTARSGSFGRDNLAKDSVGAYLTYFNKPGTSGTDGRIWTYDAKVVTVTGLPAGVTASQLQLISYAGDDVAFLEEATVGRLAEDYRYGDGTDDVIPAGTLVIAGTYRGDPVYSTLQIQGRFTGVQVTENGDIVEADPVERALDGYALFFAQIPEDKAVSDISDGLFLFVPNVQAEAALQGAGSHCSAESLLPSQIRAVLFRTDTPDSAAAGRVTAETLWIQAPGGEELPTILLEDELG